MVCLMWSQTSRGVFLGESESSHSTPSGSSRALLDSSGALLEPSTATYDAAGSWANRSAQVAPCRHLPSFTMPCPAML